MPYQVFADESEGAPPGVRNHFVMAGLIGHSDDWELFSQEWRACLDSGPRKLDYFKMKEAAGLSGQFWGWKKDARDEKVRAFARIINRHAKIVTWSVIDLEAHSRTWAKYLSKPQSEPYFHPFQNTIMAACFCLWDAGLRRPFEMIFDENLIFGLRAKAWYPMLRSVGEIREPEAATILPAEPRFKNDRDALPLQAADLYAWNVRKATNEPEYAEFHWLLDELRNVQGTNYSQYYDEERMRSVLSQTFQFVHDSSVPQHLVETARRLRGVA